MIRIPEHLLPTEPVVSLLHGVSFDTTTLAPYKHPVVAFGNDYGEYVVRNADEAFIAALPGHSDIEPPKVFVIHPSLFAEHRSKSMSHTDGAFNFEKETLWGIPYAFNRFVPISGR